MSEALSVRIGARFDSAASKVGVSTLTRHLFFVLAALLATTLIGYHFGTFDQAVHIPFLAKYGDPSLYPGDPFLEMRHQHYSFFWFIFLPFQQANVLEIAMLVAHLLFTYCTFWAIWDLTEELFHNTLTSFAAVLVMIIPHITFGGFPIIEFSLLNRTAVLPFLLWAVVLGLRGRTTLMFLLLGVLLNFHIISVAFILAMVGADLLYRRQWKALIQGGIVFLIFGAPVLAWRVMDHIPGGPEPNYEWFKAVADTTLAHLFYLFAPQLHILFVTFTGAASIALFFIARRAVESKHNLSVSIFVIVGVLLVGLQVVSVVYPHTVLMQLQIIRAGIPATIFAYIYFAHYAVTHLKSKMMVVVLALSPTALFPLIVWAVRTKIAKPEKFDIGVGAGAAVVFATMGVIGVISQLWQPGIFPYGKTTNWRDVQSWAKDNTPPDATFITPPYLMGPYTSDWRAFSQRPTIASLSDMLEIAVVPSGFEAWQERFEAIAPGALADLKGDFFENVPMIRQAYESLTPAQIDAIVQRYGATYLVSQKPRTYDYPVVYENAEFTVYEIGQ